ncbi:MAG: hypothetical protein U0Y96_00310 [Candidatus Kapaibacterium sp.]
MKKITAPWNTMVKIILTIGLILIATLIPTTNSLFCYTIPTGWQKINSDLTQIYSDSFGNVGAFGKDGTAMVSYDFGTTWKQFDTHPDFHVTSATFDKTGNLYIMDKDNNGLYSILYNKRGTKHWKLLYSTSDIINAIRYNNNSILIIGLSHIKTLDISTLTIKNIQFNNGILHVHPINSTGANVAFLDDGSIVKTQDNFNSIEETFRHNFFPQYVSTINGNVLIFLYTGEMYFSADTTRTWRKVGTFWDVSLGISLLNSTSAIVATDTTTYILKFTSADTCQQYYIDPLNRSVAINNPAFYGLSVADSAHAFICGAAKTIVTTDNSGNTWNYISYLPNNSSATLRLSFVNDTLGFATKHDNAIYKTINAGATWVPISIPTTGGSTSSQINFISEKCGCVVNSIPELLCTKNGGRAFSRIAIRGAQYRPSVILYNDSIIVATATNLNSPKNTLYSYGDIVKSPSYTFSISNVVQSIVKRGNTTYSIGSTLENGSTTASLYRSNDSGYSWNRIVIPYQFESGSLFTDISSVDNSGIVWLSMVDQHGTSVLRLNIIADTAIPENINRLNNVFTISFLDMNRGYAIGGKGVLYYTSDKGNNWRNLIEDTNNTTQYGAIQSLNSKTAFMSGNEMVDKIPYLYLLRLQSDSVNVITSVEHSVETNDDGITSVAIHNIYPHPIQSDVRIELYHDITIPLQNMAMKIYNIYGDEVADITTELKNALPVNPAIVEWDATGLLNGYYTVICTLQGHTTTKQFIISR